MLFKLPGQIGFYLQGTGQLFQPGALHGILLVNHHRADDIDFPGGLGRIGVVCQSTGIQWRVELLLDPGLEFVVRAQSLDFLSQ